MSRIIRFENVTKRFSDGTEALRDVTVEIPTNQLTVIIGPSGCGKTTFMKMINCLETPSNGSIMIDSESIQEKDPVQLRRSIGYVIQRIGLIPHMTIEENIALVPQLLGWKKQRINERVKELMEMVDLDPTVYKHRYPLELSGGQQQRVGVIRALAGDPNIILMDEPFSALDPISRDQLQHELKMLQKKIHKTIVFVTHDMDEALDIADNIIIMRDGKIVQMSTPDQLLAEQKDEFVRNFIGLKRIKSKQKFSEKRLVDLKSFFHQKPNGLIFHLDSSATVGDAVKLFEKHPEKQLEVMHEGSILGYLQSTDLLRAVIDWKGVE